ncbi:MAG: methyltransferase domain-containing protein [Bacteroidota bacterium]
MKLNRTAYNHSRLLENILTRFRKMGLLQKRITRKDLADMDEMHLQGAAVSEYLANKLNISRQSKVLDVGCGIGGPCRMLADEYECSVIGIDRIPQFIQTARVLTKMMGLSCEVSFLKANALRLPFENASFNIVWTQHILMNIANKARFFSEIRRVLKPGGRFLYYDIFSTGQDGIRYPLLWAENASENHLYAHDEVASYFDIQDYRRVYTENHSPSGIFFAKAMEERIRTGKTPDLGLDIVLPDPTREKYPNSIKALVDKKIELHAGIYVKRVERLDSQQ